MGMEDAWKTGSTSESEKAKAYREELKDTYPTPESIVDDFRHGVISQLAMPVRFPNPEDQALIRTMSEERNRLEKQEHKEQEEKWKETYLNPVLEILHSLDEDTIDQLAGYKDALEDDWIEVQELIQPTPENQEELVKKLELLTQIKAVAEGSATDKEQRIQPLIEVYRSL